MPRKTIGNRRRRVERATFLASEHAEDGGNAIERLTLPFLEDGETMPDWRISILLIVRLMLSRLRDVMKSDHDHFNQLLGTTVERQERDQWAQMLYDTLVLIRRAAEAVLGKARAAMLIPIDGRTPRATADLIEVAEHAIDNLGASDLEVPEPAVSGFVTPDPEGWKSAIEHPLFQLDEVHKKIQAKVSQARGSVGQKATALERLDHVLAHGTPVLRGLFHLAEMPKVAGGFSVRRNLRRGPESTRGQSDSDSSSDSAQTPPEPPAADPDGPGPGDLSGSGAAASLSEEPPPTGV